MPRMTYMIAALSSTVAVITPAFADTAEAPGEIIVTARKREESILNVPVIQNVVTEKQIERLQIRDLRDLASVVPGLRLGRSTLVLGSQISVRGIGTIAIDAGADQSVAFNVDNMQISSGLALQSSLFDIGQVEVLKGPQSLFFGKSSTGGVLSIATANPTEKTEFIGRIAYEAEAINPRGELILSGPVTDTLKLRVGGFYSFQKGFFRNLTQPIVGTGAQGPTYDRGPRARQYMVRGTALWSPTPELDVRLKVNLAEDRTTYPDVPQLRACPEGVTAPSGIPFMLGEDCRVDRNFRLAELGASAFPGMPNGGIPFLSVSQHYGSLDLNYQVTPEIGLHSTTGYYHLRSTSVANGTNTTAAAPLLGVYNRLTREDFTQEVRLNSEFANPINFTLGAYFSDGQIHALIDGRGNPIFRFPAQLLLTAPNLYIRSYSAFGQIRWKPTSTVEIAVGGRYTKEKRQQRTFNVITGTPVLIPSAKPEIHSNTVTPDVTLTWRPTNDLTWFAAFRQGYKSGSYSLGAQPRNGVLDNAFGDEKATGGEVGIKGRTFGQQLQFELAGYYYDFRGLQVGVSRPPTGPITETTTENAGGARTYGVDLNLTFSPQSIEDLTLYASANWNDAKFTQLDTVPCYGGQTIALGCDRNLNPSTGLFTAQSLSGSPLVRAPRWQLNAGLSYQMRLSRKMNLVFTSNNFYSSEYVTNIAANYPNKGNYQPLFFKMDFGISLEDADKKWEFQVLGKNITNKITAGTCNTSNSMNGLLLGGQVTGGTGAGVAGIDEIGCYPDAGREIWFRLTFRPFGN